MDLPDAEKEVKILIPMRLSAYLNYSSAKCNNFVNRPDNKAYLSPIPEISGQDLQGDNHSLQHDIYEHLVPPRPGMEADADRLRPGREGIYLHWSIPDHYRTAIVGSQTTTAMPCKRTDAGYDPLSHVPSDVPVHRPLPDRYMIMRAVHSPYFSERLPPSLPPIPPGPDDTTMPEGALISWFMVEANRVRKVTELRVREDYEVTTSPLPNADSVPSVLGQSWNMLDLMTQFGNRKGYEAEEINVARDANPYFADFQPHNSSVLSFFDDMTFTSGGQRCRLSGGNITYAVVGWHSKHEQDPLYFAPAAVGSDSSKRQSITDRLKAMRLDLSMDFLSNKYMDALSTGTTLNARSFCHGLRHFNWSPQQATQSGYIRSIDTHYPADDVQNAFIKSQPLAVGTSVMDALYAWLRAQPEQNDAHALRHALLKLQTFVLSNSDDLDSHLQASDMIANNNFVHVPSGTQWKLEVDSTREEHISDDDIVRARELNRHQLAFDRLERAENVRRRRLFDLWWIFVSNKSQLSRGDQNAYQQWQQKLKDCVVSVQAEEKVILTLKDKHQQALNECMKGPWKLRAPVRHPAVPFAKQRDPTLLIAGAGITPKPLFPKGLPVRVDGQGARVSKLNSGQLDPPPNTWMNELGMQKFGPWRYPMAILAFYANAGQPDYLTSIPKPLSRLFFEAWNNSPQLHDKPQDWDPKTGQGSAVKDAFWDDAFDDRYMTRNGWHPLFIEWEIEYSHIPWLRKTGAEESNWEVAPTGPEGRLAYHIRDDVDLTGVQTIRESIKGRTPVLPHVPAALRTILAQSFSKMDPEVLNATLSQDERKKLLETIDQLDYLSITLAGFTEQILGHASGTHFVPVAASKPGAAVEVHGRASELGSEIGLTSQDFQNMHELMKTVPKSGTTETKPPLGSLHGQFRFTKFNIIDRWGQVVQGITRQPKFTNTQSSVPEIEISRLFPCLGEAYSVQHLPDGRAKTVAPRDDKLCEYVQIPPCINQEARINANHIVYVKLSNAWRPVSQGEDPVACYLMLNAANRSLQLFMPSGSFLCEFSLRSGKLTTRPYGSKLKELKEDVSPSLKSFIERCGDHDWLSARFNSLSRTASSTQARPERYADSMLGLLGRPLALVHFATDLELAEPARRHASDLFKGSCPPEAPSAATKNGDPELTTDYTFPVKIGDADNIFDGLYGVFPDTAPATSSGDFDFSHFRSYHDASVAKHPDFAHLRPHWPDLNDTGAQLPSAAVRYCAIVDPFIPVHVCSAGLLPIRTVELPSDLVSSALKQMSAFFETGPVILTRDLPAFDPDAILGREKPGTEKGKIQLPVTNLKQWEWLQPYLEDEPEGKKTLYNVLDVEDIGHEPRFEGAPFTVVNGFLQTRGAMFGARS